MWLRMVGCSGLVRVAKRRSEHKAVGEMRDRDYEFPAFDYVNRLLAILVGGAPGPAGR